MNAKLKPWQLVYVRNEGYGHYGEVMSYPSPNNTVMVRRVPGHSGTLEELPVNKIEPIRTGKPRYVHYALVSGRLGFPVDMLRYEFAAPVNFKIIENDNGDYVTEIDPSFGFDGLIIARGSDRTKSNWTVDRWHSFGWKILPIKTEKISDRILR